MRSPAERALFAALFAVGLVGCALDDGQPWGELGVELAASAPATVRTAEGRSITFETVELRVDGVAIFGGQQIDTSAFDPADPPDGCTLCHGGHCHCGGDLVDYETLAARAAGIDATTEPLLVVRSAGESTPLGPESAPIALEGCPGTCEMPRGSLRRVEVRIDGIRLGGRSDDVDFDFDLPLSAPIGVSVEVTFDRGEPVGAHLDLELQLPAEILDGLDPVGPDASILTDNLATFAALTARVRRH